MVNLSLHGKRNRQTDSYSEGGINLRRDKTGPNQVSDVDYASVLDELKRREAAQKGGAMQYVKNHNLKSRCFLSNAGTHRTLYFQIKSPMFGATKVYLRPTKPVEEEGKMAA